MRSWSPWMVACTFFSFWSFRYLMMSRAASLGIPCCSVTTRRTLEPLAVSISPSFRFFTGTFRRTMPRLQDVPQRVHFHLVFGGEGQGVLGLVEVDRGRRAFEIVALRDLFSGLIDGVVDLLEVDRRGDVKR